MRAGSSSTVRADDHTWSQSVEKGKRLVSMMLANNTTAGTMFHPPRSTVESTLLDPALVPNWGYSLDEEIPKPSFHIVKTALRHLGVDDDVGNQSCLEESFFHVRYDHNQDRNINEDMYWGTGAYFSQSISRKHGVLIANSNSSPEHNGKHMHPSITMIPELKHWSDIAYLQWVDSESSSSSSRFPISNLRYIFRMAILNEKTNTIIQRILRPGDNTGNSKELIPEICPPANNSEHSAPRIRVNWPGVSFSMDSDEGRALLGSPNGCGPAYLLIQHKNQLGCKSIEKVTVFTDRIHNDWFNLLFYVKDIRANEQQQS